MLRVVLSVFVISVAGAGCTSISSTLLNRTDDDALVGNSNGEPGINCQARPFKGVPITLRLPTHLDVAIKEKIYLTQVTKDGTTTPVLTRVYTKHRNLFVEPTIIETDKVFTVDPRRPPAGTMNSTLTFGTDAKGQTPAGPDNSQYFKEITTQIKDTTIQDTTAALQRLFPKGLMGAKTSGEEAHAGTPAASLKSKLILETRTVAWKRFDMDAVDFEAQVASFVSQHMNCCNTCDAYTNDNPPPNKG